MTAERVFHHRVYGLSVDSMFALPGAAVAEASDSPADLTITWSLPETEIADRLTIAMPPTHAGAPALGIDKDGSHVLIWRGEMVIAVSADARSMRIYSRSEKLDYLPTVVMGIALGLVLHLRDVLCLHAAVLGKDDRAIAVMGHSGSGKSSLAAAMVREGATFYSDDLAAIAPGGSAYRVHLGSMGLRINPDSVAALLGDAPPLSPVPYLNKSLWDLTGQSLPAEPPRLAALYWLEPSPPGEGHSVSPPLPARDALRQLIHAWYPPYCRRLLSRARLDQMRRLAEAAPLHVVSYEKRWDALPRLLELLPR